MAEVLINALDAGNPLFFNSNENSNAYIFSVKLSGSENYKIWATAIRIALKGKKQNGFGDGSLSPELYLRQVYSEIAAEVWKELEETYDKINRSVIYNVIHKIHILKQGELSDYHKLNDVYQPIRSNLLARDPLPDVEAFNVVSRKESHRGLHPGTRSIGHPDDTLAKISPIGNLRLSANIVLFDVLVILEYCDLKVVKTVGIGNESGGLYMFAEDENELWHSRLGHPSDQVLSVLSKSIGLKYDKCISPCDICHKAKQTRDPFPLSDHKFVSVGDLVHLNLWGPYRVVSREGSMYFLTIVDGYSTVVWAYLIKTKYEVAFFIENFVELLNIQFNKKVKVFRLPSSVLSGASPYLLVYGKEPSLSHIKCFGCLCYSTMLNKHDKFSSSLNDDERYPSVDDGNVMASANINSPLLTMNKQPLQPKSLETTGSRFGIETQKITNNRDEPQTVRKSNRVSNLPSKFNDFILPSSKKYGLEKHVEAMNKEMEALFKNNTWVLTELPVNRKTIGCKWLFKIKYKSLGEIERYNARLVSKGFSQREDVNNSFLYVDLHEDVYMKLPPGYYDKSETRVYKLVKSLYGLKQALRQWNEKLTNVLKENDFEQSFCGNLISWKSKKQATISRASAETEYRCMTSTTCEVIWLTHLLKDLGVDGLLLVHLYCDSTYAIQIAANPVFHEKTKHFEIDVHLVGEKVASSVISTVKVNSANNVVDIFTKSLSIPQHKMFCEKLNMLDMFEV
ncbi:ribonuclease H-like domain-containing protein [Tanacetum coccineum]